MAENPFREFYYERLSIHVQDEDQWEKLLDILEQEEDMYAGFDRNEYRDSKYYYIFHAYDQEEVHCGPYAHLDYDKFIEFEDMVAYRWPHLLSEVECGTDVDIGQLF